METRIRDHIRSNAVGYVAVFIALSGTAYAVDGPLAGQNTVGSADIINGEVQNKDLGTDAVASGKIADRQVKNADLSIGASSSNTIADGGVQGIDVKDETLTGDDVDELSLLPVPTAHTLDGIDSNGFIKGQGRAFSASETVPENVGIEILRSHQFEGRFSVYYTCPQDSPNNGGVVFVNHDTVNSVRLFADNGSPNPSFFGILGPAPASNHTEVAAASGDYITFQGSYSNEEGTATIHVFSQHDPASDSCYAQAQAVVTRP